MAVLVCWGHHAGSHRTLQLPGNGKMGCDNADLRGRICAFGSADDVGCLEALASPTLGMGLGYGMRLWEGLEGRKARLSEETSDSVGTSGFPSG